MKYLSVFETDSEILNAIDDIFLKNKWYDLDCTYSKGCFYKQIKQPRLKSDLTPLTEDTMQSDSRELNFVKDGTLNSIVFDPPFLFRKRKAKNNDWISSWYTYFNSYEDLQEMYEKSLQCFHKKLTKGGYVCFKCQDMTDGKFYCTHNFVINKATEIGFDLKDIIIKKSNRKLQKDAKKQNCVAKIHSYWLVFKKK